MAEEFSSLINSIEGLKLADGTAKSVGLDSNRLGLHETALAEAIRALIQTAGATATLAQRLPLTRTTCTWGGQGIAQLSSLRRRANTLASVTATFSDAAERYIVAHIRSLADHEIEVQKLLSFFDSELRSIAQAVLNNTGDDSSVLREILELCYSQSLCTSGSLHFDNYFAPQQGAGLAWPYDPDFESEEFYEHEYRLAVDEDYAEAFRVRCECKYENKRKYEEQWIGFWVRALSRCPNGPTLFYPPASCYSQWHFADIPRYLFRAFDRDSSGLSDDNTVASMESIYMTSSRNKKDLLLRPEKEARGMLYRHLTKPCFGGAADDNLMSWSSSLLFVIQYAIWRCHHRRSVPSEVKICVVDTRKFPRGQFARDMSLLRGYRQTPEIDKKMWRFFNFRLENADYDNGEYLSQGELHHTGRSCVFSFEHLIQAGLYSLYPEFADSSAMGLWTKRVVYLRSEWSAGDTTTHVDIQKAFKIAGICFNQFDASDVALLLLSFKNRKLRTNQYRRNPEDYGPAEVQRYMEIVETMMPKDQGGSDGQVWPTSLGTQLVETVFETI
jgi:hypothetical protein